MDRKENARKLTVEAIKAIYQARANSTEQTLINPTSQAARDIEDGTAANQSALQINEELKQPKRPNGHSESLPVAVSESQQTPTPPELVVDTSTTVLGLPPPRRRRFAELATRSQGCHCIQSLHLNDWQATQTRFQNIFARIMWLSASLYHHASSVLKNSVLHIFRQILSALMLGITTFWLVDIGVKIKVEPILIVTLALGVLYVLIQNAYFFFLRQKLSCILCFSDPRERAYFFALFYPLIAAPTAFMLWNSAKNALETEQALHIVLGVFMTIMLLMQLSMDTLMLHLCCAATFLLGVVMLLVLMILYRLCFYLCCLWCCQRDPNTAQLERKERILAFLQDLCVVFTPLIQTSCCSICLLDYKPGDNVVILDCSPAHVFHYVCAGEWLQKANLCPICRAPPLPREAYES